MAPPVYTRRLAAVRMDVVAGWTVLYVHQGPGSCVIRDIVVTHGNETPVAFFTLLLAPITRTGEVSLVELREVPAGTYHLDLRQELLVNEQLMAYSDLAGVSILITAYVFQSG